ncbi:MAG: tRNA lysidine(34) synthetase TilS [Cyclobacteriaceae bacterium]|nr:tRNA lysidine(34) synthetase TilS [Cyclobacteriaceae bacterium]
MTGRILKFPINSDISGESKFLLAVSGGIDSMVMVDMFMKAGLRFVVAHCNFRLRGKESDEDEQFVGNFCRDHKISFLTKTFSTKNHAKKLGISVEMAARELRYEWFSQLMEEMNFHFLCTAHHQNDSLETALFNLTKGTGIAGLRGIRPLAGYILRPLLEMTRRDIVSYAGENNLLWREDRTNREDVYHRNYIRHHVVPALEKINPNVTGTFVFTSERIRGAESLLEKYLQEIAGRIISNREEVVCIDKTILGRYSMEEAKTILYSILKSYGFEYGRMTDIYDSLKGQPGKRFEGEGHVLYSDRDCWCLARNVGEEEEAVVKISQEDVQVNFGDQQFKISIVEKKDWCLVKEKKVAQLDASRLVFPLEVRKWQKGDFFSPLGLKGKKKVSDYMIDRKIPLTLKRHKLVFLSGKNIIWLSGEQIDDHYKVEDKTERILLIEAL